MTYLGLIQVVVLTRVIIELLGNGGHDWPVHATVLIVTQEQIASTRKPRLQFSMNVQDFYIDAEGESPKPVQTNASDV
jgi:hypothetical protein